MTRIAKVLVIASMAFALLFSVPAWSTVITLESGLGSIDSYNTALIGNSANPWLISETFTAGPVVLKFFDDAGFPLGNTNTTGTINTYDYGKWIQKTVTNNTGAAWSGFELELHSALGQPSGEGDGLSFAQEGGLVFSSDKFTDYTRIDGIKDYLNFFDGTVGPGETVIFQFAITDIVPADNPFWLSQNAINAVPEPATMLLLGSGLLGMGVYARKRFRKK